MKTDYKKLHDIKMRYAEISILQYLLGQHLFEGSYFGKKNEHYKMCRALMDKLDKELWK